MKVLDAEKVGGAIVILNDNTHDEFYRVAPSHRLPARERHDLEQRLAAAGFRAEYQFKRTVSDRRSQTLAKAQAASLAKRILNKTGIQMEVARVMLTAG